MGTMKVNRLLVPVLLVLGVSWAAAQSEPGAQALALYKAIQKQSWKDLYYLAAYSPSIKKQLPPADEFAAQVKKGIEQTGNAKAVDMLFNNMSNIKVGRATVTGNHATVPTSSDVAISGKTIHFVGAAKMVKDGDAWKWDLSTSTDLQKATASAMTELIGKPAN